MARLTWDQLDSFQTADEVAGCLRRVGVKGLQASCEYCPLAVATGWIVTHRRRWWPWNDTKEAPLTAAQRAFTLSFDQGGYPDLIIGVKVKMALLIMNKDAIKRHPRLAAKATKRLTRTPSPHIEECAGCGVAHVLDCIGNGMYLQPPHDCNFTRVVRLSRFEIMVAQS